MTERGRLEERREVREGKFRHRRRTAAGGGSVNKKCRKENPKLYSSPVEDET